MAYDPRSGRIVEAEANEKYPEMVAQQNIRTSSIKSIIIVTILISSFIGILLTIFALGL